MTNINAGDKGAIDFIIASQKTGETWLENLESKVNGALEEMGKKCFFSMTMLILSMWFLFRWKQTRKSF